MEFLKEYNDVLRANECLVKPVIPKLPEDEKELSDLLDRNFEVLYESRAVSEHGGEYRPGGVAITDLTLKCPFCGMEFNATRRSGCFMHNISPDTCPNCNFPKNVLDAAISKFSNV